MPQPTTTQTTSEWRTVRMEVLQRIEALPSLSSVVAEFLDLTRKEFFTAKDFEAVICKDQALVARLLRLANSGIYGKPRSIRSVAEAVVLIGLDEMKKIVYAVGSERLIRRDLKNYRYAPEAGFWAHSLAVGLAAREIANAAPACSLHGEEAFVAGLLHDAGKLVIDDFLDSRAGPRLITRKDETEATGLDHAELAEHIFKQWRIPTTITAPVRDHHANPLEAGSHIGGVVIQLAQTVCSAWRIGQEDETDLVAEIPFERQQGVLDRLALTSDQLPELVWNIRKNLVGLEDLFRAPDPD
jgi:HD-like signal output (HDOD) protein